jgi:hypothetical protein
MRKIQEVVRELYHQDQGDMSLRLMISGGFNDYVRWDTIGISWLARKTLKEYMNGYVAKQSPGKPSDIEVWVGITVVGKTKEAEEFAKKVYDFLDNDKEATELRDLLPKLAEKADLINSAIEKELKKG